MDEISTSTNVILDSLTTSNISKNQLKRLKKKQIRIDNKILKKEKKKLFKKRKLDEIQDKNNVIPISLGNNTIDHTLSTNENIILNENIIINDYMKDNIIINHKENISRKFKKEETISNYLNLCKENFSLIIDCNFESIHTENTLKSLSQQIMFCYGINRRHSNPATLYLTGIGSQLKSNLDKVCCDKWINVNITTEDYIQHPHFSIDNINNINNNSSNNDDNNNHTIDNKMNRKQLVYLTSDAEETLDTLDPNCAYIIGGIVDRNKYKGITYKKAYQQQIKTAKLPIKEYFSLSATHVLTVNHVFEIILNYMKYKDWKQAIKDVIPIRKGYIEKDMNKVLDNNITETDNKS